MAIFDFDQLRSPDHMVAQPHIAIVHQATSCNRKSDLVAPQCGLMKQPPAWSATGAVWESWQARAFTVH